MSGPKRVTCMMCGAKFKARRGTAICGGCDRKMQRGWESLSDVDKQNVVSAQMKMAGIRVAPFRKRLFGWPKNFWRIWASQKEARFWPRTQKAWVGANGILGMNEKKMIQLGKTITDQKYESQ